MKFDITCSNDNCEAGFEFEVEFDPGEKASWGYSGGSPEVPPSWIINDDVTCPICGENCLDKAEQIVADHRFEDDEPDYDDRDE